MQSEFNGGPNFVRTFQTLYMFLTAVHFLLKMSHLISKDRELVVTFSVSFCFTMSILCIKHVTFLAFTVH
jgi:hypothetical protein